MNANQQPPKGFVDTYLRPIVITLLTVFVLGISSAVWTSVTWLVANVVLASDLVAAIEPISSELQSMRLDRLNDSIRNTKIVLARLNETERPSWSEPMEQLEALLTVDLAELIQDRDDILEAQNP